MIGHRIIFAFIALFLFLVITISTAPILDRTLVTEIVFNLTTNETVTTTTEPINYDNESESNETSIEQDMNMTTFRYTRTTTSIPETVTSGFLVGNFSEVSVSIDDLIKINDSFLSTSEDEVPATPIESPESVKLNTTRYI
ncbi:unnamed protein product [Adineta steineri]|uniref:Uncharacterized protein n=1 Tax=Adineta steineri TaxID=433720 RepID=A0A815CQC5_9BILA|nr:unnamed protein product [Adineta steineri]CAF1408996.1 unnamed protein product [Adineta steineri]